ncbi:MAG: signal peptide peptidase SppA [Fibrobacteres bacterium]|jgi:protease-4|nr:signal peptide peptidase SppA [Fibrobacterota bacterium]
MVLRYVPVIALFASLSRAWDSPMPFAQSPATAVSQGAFANPAAAGFGEDTRGSLGWAGWDARPDARQRLWALEQQGPGWAGGFRYWEGAGPYLARFDLAGAWNALDLFTFGLRPAYVWDGQGPDHLLLDGGLDFRPWPQLLLGAWTENLATAGDERRTHRLAASLRPFAVYPGGWADLDVGYGFERQGPGKHRGYVFGEIPLFAGLRTEAQWDPGRGEGSLGVTLQLSGRMAAGIGAARGGGAPPGMRNRLGADLARRERADAAMEWRTAQKAPFLASDGAVAEIDLNRDIQEGETDEGWFQGKSLGFVDLMRRFDVLESDRHLRAVAVKLGSARCGWSMGEEIRDRLLRLRARGVRTVAYMEEVSPLNYYLATACGTIAMQPQGHFAVNGFAAEVMFYRGLFDKLGVEPQFLRHGKFKSFEEPYTRTSMSEPMRSDLQGFIASLWDNFLAESARARGLPKDSLRKALESPEIGLEHAVRAHLIDTLIYADQLAELAGGKGAHLDGNQPDRVARTTWDIPPQIAIVVVTGDMVVGSSARSWLTGPDLAGSETVAGQLRKARKDPSVKAVVLRVDSPGGSAQAADIMWREVELLKKAGKPVVASVGRDAASGGYYLICGADKILAAPNSVLGSIGVLWGKFVLKGLFDKLGLKSETVKTSPHADGTSMTRAWDSTETDALQRHMDKFYDDFITKVANGRHMPKARVDSLGQGRIFTGVQAAANGLADELGGLGDAISTARKLAGIGPRRDVEVVVFSAQGESSVLPIPGMGVSRARGAEGLAVGIKQETDRISALAKPDLWALDPELAGWNVSPLAGWE